MYLTSPPEICRALSNIVRRCTYLVCFCRVTNYNVCQVSSLSRLFELELIQTQMTQKPMLRAEVGMRVRCANKASAD